MKRCLALLLFAVAAPQVRAQDRVPNPASVELSAPKRITLIGKTGRIRLAPRDSLLYTLRWGKGVNATGYRVTVTPSATPTGTTSGLPSSTAVTDTTITFTAINNTFDSLSLNASVVSTRGTRTSAAATRTWFVVRIPGTPGGIQVDSSAIPPLLTSLDVAMVPPSLNIGSTGAACAYFRFGTKAAMRTQDATGCQTDFIGRYTSTQRNVTAATQLYTDRACVTWTSSNTAIATVRGESCPLARVGGFVQYASLQR